MTTAGMSSSNKSRYSRWPWSLSSEELLSLAPEVVVDDVNAAVDEDDSDDVIGPEDVTFSPVVTGLDDAVDVADPDDTTTWPVVTGLDDAVDVTDPDVVTIWPVVTGT
eukprot:TRINITY_DN1223_c0_g1_i3.p3 TRINITY_DN1223_c0_g1~~TRINITY_DN1223_c0_g1_i3.p3  ORF type:complete len:108 (+),score=10.63 TRINITY_DN1223_c0_g1_i3:136-459(+)